MREAMDHKESTFEGLYMTIDQIMWLGVKEKFWVSFFSSDNFGKFCFYLNAGFLRNTWLKFVLN